MTQLFMIPPSFSLVARLMKNEMPISSASRKARPPKRIISAASEGPMLKAKASTTVKALPIASRNRSKGVLSMALALTSSVPSRWPAAHMRKTKIMIHSSSVAAAMTIRA